MIKHPVSPGDTYYLYVTFYGDEFEGKDSADGSKFSNSEMTCAARGFPFGTMLEIQSLETGKKVVVKVTDRPGKNVVDLTQTAFSQIDNPQKGKIRAKIKVVDKGDVVIEETKSYAIELGSFNDLESAKKFQESQNTQTYIFAVKGSKNVYSVRYGRFTSKDDAENYRSSNFSDKEAIVVEIVE
jgi:rare lipoprotein A